MKKDKLIISGMTVASFLLTGVAAKAATFQMDDASGVKNCKHEEKKEGSCGEGKCGEGKCQSDMKGKGSAAATKTSSTAKDKAEGGCGEGTCGSHDKKDDKKN